MPHTDGVVYLETGGHKKILLRHGDAGEAAGGAGALAGTRAPDGADRFVWRDDGQGGRAGSLWATPNMDLMLCVRGHEPGEEERTVWCLKEEKCSSDNVGWLVSQ